MAKFNNTEGVWIAYDLDNTYEVKLYSEDPVEIIAFVSDRGYGQIAFWPVNTEVADGIKWWHDHAIEYETQEEKLKRIITENEKSIEESQKWLSRYFEVLRDL